MLRLLAAAPRSRQQLAEALARRDVPQATADAVLDRFTEVGLIDDGEYARMLVRSKHESRGLARRGLAAELRRRGVGEHDAQTALDELDPEDEAATARRLLDKRWESLRGVAPEVRARRVMGTLGRKGYPPGLVARLVRERMDADGHEPWDSGVADVE
ncbi:regulatory protein RecX [Cellulomonas bogoriensis]|uniref:regulatory protein RecX n=1 Tax=Cellulomonas bogoriensis TaxID=301388 RepID=UPI000B324BB2|nr:regulatory protein RecX [Cellulomonas bogoriensis]